MIGIATQTGSEYALVLKEDVGGTEIENYTRRISRSATLDGGSEITDLGYTDTDRTLVIEADLTVLEQAMLKAIIQNYSVITVSTKDGCFVCSPRNFRLSNGRARITIWIKE